MIGLSGCFLDRLRQFLIGLAFLCFGKEQKENMQFGINTFSKCLLSDFAFSIGLFRYKATVRHLRYTHTPTG